MTKKELISMVAENGNMTKKAATTTTSATKTYSKTGN